MTDTTNISDLPSNNITLEMKEKRNTQPMLTDNTPVSTEMPNNAANKIVSGIQSASAANMTGLPSRDIPMMTHPHTQDKRSRPNFVPQPKHHTDYIDHHDSIQSMMQKERKQQVKEDRLEHIYEEIQTPVFVMILFLFFQLPSFQRLLQRQLPSLFSKEGRPHFGGYLLKMILFGGSFYLIQKGTKYLSHQAGTD